MEGIAIKRYLPYPLLHLLAPLVLLLHGRNIRLTIDAATPVGYFSNLFTNKPTVTIVYHLASREVFHPDVLGTRRSFGTASLAYLGDMLTLRNIRGRPVITFSKHTADALRKLDPPPSPVIYVREGIRLPEYQKAFDSKPNNNQLVTVGRVVRSKGIEFSIRAVEKLRKNFPEIVLHVIGTGPDLDRLGQIAANLKLEKNVIFHGFVSEEEKNSIVANSKLIIITSKVEGFSTPAIEAGAFGVPTVAFDEAGTREAVEDNVTGIIVPFGNVEALSNACAMLFWDEPLYLELSENAKIRAKEYDINLMATEGANALISLSRIRKGEFQQKDAELF